MSAATPHLVHTGHVGGHAQHPEAKEIKRGKKGRKKQEELSDEILVEELNAVHGELSRVDSKSSMLLGFAAGGLLLGTASLPTGIAGGLIKAGLGFAAASIVPLLAVVRPRLGRGGFAHHARRTPAQIREELGRVDTHSYRAEQLIALSRIAVRKFKLLRVAAALQTLALIVASAGAVMVMIVV